MTKRRIGAVLMAAETNPEPSLALLVEQGQEGTVARRLSPAQIARVEGRPLPVEPVQVPEPENAESRTQ